MLKNIGENFYFADISKINILVTGFSGSGKSTLINNILNSSCLETAIGKLVTKEIVSVTKDGVPLQFFDTPGFEIDPKKQKKLLNNIFQLLKYGHTTKDTNNYIHCIWYCVNGESKRFQDYEIEYIKKINQNRKTRNIPIVIVLTQCIDNKVKNTMIEVIKQEKLKISAIIPVLAQEKEIHLFGQNVTIQPFGIDELIENIIDLVPIFLKRDS